MEWVADFETNTTENGVAQNPVWAWGACVFGGDKVDMGTSIESFMLYAFAAQGRCWFHNLGFDGRFIIAELFRSGFTWVDKRKPLDGEFTTLIDDLGKFYQITVKSDGRAVQFADSYKKIPFKLGVVAATYGLDVTKGDLDYKVFRPCGHALTTEERDYLTRDVLILAKALPQRFSLGDKLTTGSDCLTVYKDMVGKHKWSNYFPVSREYEPFIRKAYRGGFVYAAPNHTYTNEDPQDCHNGITLDVNSLYPYVMRTKPLPYGHPRVSSGEPTASDKYPLWIAEVTYTAELKEGALPMIQVKGDPAYKPREYQERIAEPVTQVITSVDFDLMCKAYTLDVWHWGTVLYYKASVSMFVDYVDQGMEKKTHAANKGERTTAKLWLNNLYGKFAQKTRVCGKVPVLDTQSGVVHYKKGRESTRHEVYLPCGVFITAWARFTTITTAFKFKDRFAYADTDSIHAVGRDIPPGIRVHESELGAWKVESRWEKARFLRAKTYVEVEGGKCNYVCAGMVDGVKERISFDEFAPGFTTEGDSRFDGCNKLVPRDVYRGVVLEDRPFTIR